MSNVSPNFTAPSFLQAHIHQTLAFYEANALDACGGFFHHFLDDGHVYDASTRHLVSSARFVFNYARAAAHFDDSQYREWAKHGLDYLQQVHYQPATGGYAWLIQDDAHKLDQDRSADSAREVVDDKNHCYGFAFVMVAAATALIADIPEAKPTLTHVWEQMEQHFWDSQHGLYADEANADFSHLSSYRGQNANMHACEALIWAYRATQDQRYLDRAMLIAEHICQRQAALADGWIWEHYDAEWRIDWEYNQHDPQHLFRPWGFQPGHQIEWAKLLCQLYRIDSRPWLLERARALFDTTIAIAWDEMHGGIVYGLDTQHDYFDTDKYFWVQAESLAAAYQLYSLTHVPTYLNWYQRIWQYSWSHMVDHEYGAWYRILTRENDKIEPYKSPAGKTDYHTMGACYEVLELLNNDA